MPLPKFRLKRLLQFSLRTMLVIVLLLSVWLWRTKEWVGARRALLEKDAISVLVAQPGDKKATVPGLLWLWQERGVTRLYVRAPDATGKVELRNSPPAVAARARELFPEAIIVFVERFDVSIAGYRFRTYTWSPGEQWIDCPKQEGGGILRTEEPNRVPRDLPRDFSDSIS